MQSEWVSWVMYKDENERWGKCTSSLRRAIDSDAPVMETNVSISCCDGLAIVVDFPKASEREREREREVWFALWQREKVCVLVLCEFWDFFGFWFFSWIKVKQRGWYLYVLREKQRVCALFFLIQLYVIF